MRIYRLILEIRWYIRIYRSQTCCSPSSPLEAGWATWSTELLGLDNHDWMVGHEKWWWPGDGTWYGGFHKWGYRIIDGLFHGKSYSNGWLGGTPISGNHHIIDRLIVWSWVYLHESLAILGVPMIIRVLAAHHGTAESSWPVPRVPWASQSSSRRRPRRPRPNSRRFGASENRQESHLFYQQ